MNSQNNWIMIVLTLIFVLFYTTALLGWLKPLSDMVAVARIEPILFVIIGYYFASLPAEKTQAVMKEEVTDQTKKADAARHSREQVQQEREILREKLKNARTILMSAVGKRSSKTMIKNSLEIEKGESSESLRYSILMAADILNS